MSGVAMTLVATTLLPSVQTHKASVVDMLCDMNGDLGPVVLSFAIAARYGVSQQQRLAMTNSVTANQTRLHLLFLFLFLIVLMPISPSLNGLIDADATEGAVMIHGVHLTLLALVNLLLWIGVARRDAAHLPIMRSSLALAVLVVALAAGLVRPGLALYVWL